MYQEYKKRYKAFLEYLIVRKHITQIYYFTFYYLLVFNTFLSIWKCRMSSLKILPPGSDFCDTCTNVDNFLQNGADECTSAQVRKILQRLRYDSNMEFRKKNKLLCTQQNRIAATRLCSVSLIMLKRYCYQIFCASLSSFTSIRAINFTCLE